ncbi:MAG: outer membrane beta-barrel family protein [Mediterranea sp.]|jgi:hypothetical protein|nr:outer membrane beta-barrel family protein [Mediterranea sp.]
MKRVKLLLALCLANTALLAQTESIPSQAEPYKMEYDLRLIVKNQPVDNAYEAIRKLPGVMTLDGAILVGGEEATLTINGEASMLSDEQVRTILANTPVDWVDTAELMYHASADQLTSGAIININLRRTDDDQANSLRGELYAKYRERHYPSAHTRGNLFLKQGKLSADLTYGYTFNQEYASSIYQRVSTGTGVSDGYSEPWFYSSASSRISLHDVRLNASYAFAPNHQLSLTYATESNNDHSETLDRSDMDTPYGTYVRTESNQGRQMTQTHDARMDYLAPFGMKAGVEFKFVKPESDWMYRWRQFSVDENGTEDPASYGHSHSWGHSYDRTWRFYLAQTHQLPLGWRLNYGAYYTLYSGYRPETAEDVGGASFSSELTGVLLSSDSYWDAPKRTQSAQLYAGFEKVMGRFAVEGFVRGVWFGHTRLERWHFFPNINLTYTLSPDHVFRLGLKGNKRDTSVYGFSYYPIYNPDFSYIAKWFPISSKEYSASLSYTLKKKYVFSVWLKRRTLDVNDLEQGLFTNVYDHRDQAGLQASMSHTFGNWLESRVMLSGAWEHNRGTDAWSDYPVPFNRVSFWGMARMTNIFTLPVKPDLKFTLTGIIYSFRHRGYLNVPTVGSLDTYLRYTSPRGRVVATLYGTDLLGTYQVVMRVPSDPNKPNRNAPYREFGASVAWKFGR